MKLTITLLFLLLFISSSNAQQKSFLQVDFESLVSSGNNLPFWLTSNQYGKYNSYSSANQLLSFQGYYNKTKLFNTAFDVEAGYNFISSYSDNIDVNFNELYAKFHLWNWKLEGGLFREPEYYYRLSSSNGNIERSNNARPYPRIRFGTNEFIPFLFWKNWFSFKAEYDEGLLNDQRFVDNTHLHHKSLYLKTKIAKKTALSFGLNHWVMWGGTSPVENIGEMPGLKYYFTYILGRIGTEAFPETDQLNVAGNQLGTYRLQLEFPINEYAVNMYICHPFEDYSGWDLRNYEDNLYGVFVDLGPKKIISKIIYEFMFTFDQSGHVDIIGVMSGNDDYFNHYVYKSGFTYKGKVMASPFFSPLVFQDGIVIGIENTRIAMYHIGFSGELSKHLNWDGKFTYSKNLGTFELDYLPYHKEYLPRRHQFSSVLNFNYSTDKLPFQLSFSVASDVGQLYENRIGAMLKLSKTW